MVFRQVDRFCLFKVIEYLHQFVPPFLLLWRVTVGDGPTVAFYILMALCGSPSSLGYKTKIRIPVHRHPWDTKRKYPFRFTVIPGMTCGFSCSGKSTALLGMHESFFLFLAIDRIFFYYCLLTCRLMYSSKLEPFTVCIGLCGF